MFKIFSFWSVFTVFFIFYTFYCETLPNKSFLNEFSSKTAYRNSRLSEFTEEIEKLGKCKLVHLNTLFRHGSRFPGKKNIIKVQGVHKKIINSFSRLTLPENFVRWRTPFSPTKDKLLTAVGLEEMNLLGKRFRKKMKDIDGVKDFVKHVHVASSSLSRSKNSAVAFLKSFLGSNHSEEELLELITEDDDQLRFFDNCPQYTKSLLKDKSSKTEYKEFMKGQEIKQVIKDIKDKWKLEDVDLTADDIRTLYVMCGFEIATNFSMNMKPRDCHTLAREVVLPGCPYEPMFTPEETSPLCSLLEAEHFPVFEYFYDLKHYWTKSYQKEINWLQSCDLMFPMLEQIMKAARGHQAAVKVAAVSRRPLEYYLEQQQYLRAAFRFAHAETLLPLITLLGLFNQSTPMVSTSYRQRLAALKDPRQRFSTFRVSNISPFSGNVALKLHHCPHLAKAGERSGYRVQVEMNEKAVAWSLSQEGGASHIPLETFMKHVSLCLPEKYDHQAVCVDGLPSAGGISN